MKFSKRDQFFINRMKTADEDYVPWRKLEHGCPVKASTKNRRVSLQTSFRRLLEKLKTQGIHVVRVTPWGRGHRGLYRVDPKIRMLDAQSPVAKKCKSGDSASAKKRR